MQPGVSKRGSRFFLRRGGGFVGLNPGCGGAVAGRLARREGSGVETLISGRLRASLGAAGLLMEEPWL